MLGLRTYCFAGKGMQCGAPIAVLALSALLCACTGVVDALLSEHEHVTQGAFHGFHIGEDKMQVLVEARLAGVLVIEIPGYLNHSAKPTLFELRNVPPTATSSLMSFDSWRFETPEKPAGAFYEVRFAHGKLAEISYARPRMQVE